MKPTEFFVIYWERGEERGFVSYNNPQGDEYHPVSMKRASVYSTKSAAERTKNWYLSRGGLGDFIILKVEVEHESRGKV
jgi:hypothetical protein